MQALLWFPISAALVESLPYKMSNCNITKKIGNVVGKSNVLSSKPLDFMIYQGYS